MLVVGAVHDDVNVNMIWLVGLVDSTAMEFSEYSDGYVTYDFQLVLCSVVITDGAVCEFMRLILSPNDVNVHGRL